MIAVEPLRLRRLIESFSPELRDRISHVLGIVGTSSRLNEMVGWFVPTLPWCYMISRITLISQSKWTISTLMLFPSNFIPQDLDLGIELENGFCFPENNFSWQTVNTTELIDFSITLFSKIKQDPREAIMAQKQNIWAEADEFLDLLHSWQDTYLSPEEMENNL